MASTEQAFIEARQDRYRIAHNNLDVENFMKWFAEEVDYSDHGALSVFPLEQHSTKWKPRKGKNE
jgi:hypothetical protein